MPGGSHMLMTNSWVQVVDDGWLAGAEVQFGYLYFIELFVFELKKIHFAEEIFTLGIFIFWRIITLKRCNYYTRTLLGFLFYTPHRGSSCNPGVHAQQFGNSCLKGFLKFHPRGNEGLKFAFYVHSFWWPAEGNSHWLQKQDKNLHGMNSWF